jgi:DNA-binding NarL/FixJ family response regulator
MDATQISQAAPVSPPKARHTILFLAANPLSTDELALDREARAIQEELERSGHRDQFELVTRWAVEPMDLLRELRRLKPTLVHFSGHGKTYEPLEGGAARHGEPDGLFFHGPDGRPQFIPAAALEESFAAAGAAVSVVVLSACFSESQISALAERVECVVGVGGAIRDAAARAFSIGFYGGLGDSESVGAAFRQGLAAMRLQELTHGIRPGDVPSAALPRLVTRPGLDPNELFLLHRPTRRARCSIVIKASLAEFDAIAIARLRDQLRTLSGDVSLEIIEVQEGSVRLTVSLSPEAAVRLGELHESGELGARISFEVSSFQECGVDYVEDDATVEPSRAEIGQQFADFAGAKLNGANFSKINLERANFSGADLSGANLERSIEMAPGTKQRIVLVDDHVVFRKGLGAVLGADASVEVAGEATVREAIELASRAAFDLAIVDVTLHDQSGASVTREFRRLQPRCKILALSMVEAPYPVAELLRAGAAGYALKSQPPQEIVDAIHEVLRGGRYLAPQLPRDQIEAFVAGGIAGPLDRLSPREREVFDLLIRGWSNERIATALFIAVRTAETHRQNIMTKLGVHSIVGLLRLGSRIS